MNWLLSLACLICIDVELVRVSPIELEVRVSNSISYPYSAIQAEIHWDKDRYILLGAHFDGTAPHMAFPAFHPDDPYGLNADLDDGDALLIVLGQLGADLPAEPEGTLIATVMLMPLYPGEACAELPEVSVTVVYSGVIPNFDVTGELSGVDCERERK